MLENALFAKEQLGLNDSEGSSPTIYSSLTTFIETVKLIIFIVFFMSNLIICFPIASIQEINQRGWQDMTTVISGLSGQSSSTLFDPRTGWSAHLYKATRWFICWMCGSKVDRYGKGEAGRLWTWKCASHPLSSSCWAA